MGRKLIVGQGLEVGESKYFRGAMTKKQYFLFYLFGVSHIAADNHRKAPETTHPFR
jgi:hypothetical protein